MDPAVSVGVFVGLGIFFLWSVCSAVTIAILYKKAGQSYWSAFIPVQHGMIMAKIAQKPIWTGVVFGITYDMWTLFSLISLHGAIRGVVSLVAMIFGLYLLHHFIKRFDRGLGFWIVWLFLPFITVFLAKNATYKGLFPTNTPVTPQQPGGTPFAQPAPLGTPQPFQPVAPQEAQPFVPQPQGQSFAQQPPQPIQPTMPPVQPQAQPFVAQPAPAPAPVQDQTYPPASQPPMGPTV